MYDSLLLTNKKPGSFLFWMKAFEWNLIQKALKLGPNDNWGIEFKLFISNWKRFDLCF